MIITGGGGYKGTRRLCGWHPARVHLQYPDNAGNPSNNEHAMRDSYAEGCWGRSIAIAPGQSTMLF